MKAFQFRLQAVLTLREQAEQAAQQCCARTCAAVSAALANVRVAEEAIAASEEARRTQLAAGARADQVEQLRTFAVLLGERRAGRVLELAEERRRADKAWRLLVVATQRREALERLRDRQQLIHACQAARLEQKVLDELAGRSSRLAETWRNVPANV